jgi:hypothetical protein
MIHKIDLPNPSNELITQVKKYAVEAPINYSSVEWHKTIQNGKVNCASGYFFTQPSVTELALTEFAGFFTTKITPMIGVLSNINDRSVASYPPHTDRTRTMTLNYYIDLGGENVSTVFYTKKDDTILEPDFKVFTYEQVDPICSLNLSSNIWYALNVQKIHSVENINTTRIMLALSLYDCDFNDLKNTIKPIFNGDNK